MFADTLADLSRLDASTRLALGGLSAEEMGAFVRASTDAEASAELTSALGELTDGTPLLLCELWRELRESGARRGGRRRPAPVPAAGRAERPRADPRARAAAPLASDPRVGCAARAGSRCRAALRAAACLPRPPGSNRRGSPPGSRRRCGPGSSRSCPSRRPAGRFTHELVRRAVYDRISGIRRARATPPGRRGARTRPPSRSSRRVARARPPLHPGCPGRRRRARRRLQPPGRPGGPRSRGPRRGRRQAPDRARARHRRPARACARRGRAQLPAVRDGAGCGGRGAAGGGHRNRHRSRRPRAGGAPAGPARRCNGGGRDPAWNAVEMEQLAEQAIETFRELGDQLGTRQRRAAARPRPCRPGPYHESLAAHERALAHADAAGDQVARRRNLASLGAGLCGGSTPVAEGIRRCEELREAYRDDRVLEAVLTRFLSLLYAMAGRSEDALESARASSRVLDELQERTQSLIHAALRRRGAGAGRRPGRRRARVDGEVAAVPRPRRQRTRPGRGRRPPPSSPASIATRAAGRRPPTCSPTAATSRTGWHADAGTIARARLAAHRGEHAEALTLIERAVERRGAQRQPRPCEPTSGSRSPRCSGRPATSPRPTPPSRGRSSSTSRRATSPPPRACGRRPRRSRYLNCAFATRQVPLAVSCTPVRFVLKAANVIGL